MENTTQIIELGKSLIPANRIALRPIRDQTQAIRAYLSLLQEHSAAPC